MTDLQSQVNSVCQLLVCSKSDTLKVIGRFNHDGIACKTRVELVSGHWSALVSFDPSFVCQSVF